MPRSSLNARYFREIAYANGSGCKSDTDGMHTETSSQSELCVTNHSIRLVDKYSPSDGAYEGHSSGEGRVAIWGPTYMFFSLSEAMSQTEMDEFNSRHKDYQIGSKTYRAYPLEDQAPHVNFCGDLEMAGGGWKVLTEFTYDKQGDGTFAQPMAEFLMENVKALPRLEFRGFEESYRFENLRPILSNIERRGIALEETGTGNFSANVSESIFLEITPPCDLEDISACPPVISNILFKRNLLGVPDYNYFNYERIPSQLTFDGEAPDPEGFFIYDEQDPLAGYSLDLSTEEGGPTPPHAYYHASRVFCYKPLE